MTETPQEKKSSALPTLIVLLVLLGGGGLGALGVMRPDLSPFDGRLHITVSFHQTNNLKPGAAVMFKDQQVGKVTAIDFDKSKEKHLVRITFQPETKKYARSSSQFSIASHMLGLTDSTVVVSVDDLNAPQLTHGAEVSGQDGLAGKIADVKKAFKKAKDDISKSLKKNFETPKDK